MAHTMSFIRRGTVPGANNGAEFIFDGTGTTADISMVKFSHSTQTDSTHLYFNQYDINNMDVDPSFNWFKDNTGVNHNREKVSWVNRQNNCLVIRLMKKSDTSVFLDFVITDNFERASGNNYWTVPVKNVNYQFSGNKFSANDELLLRLNGNVAPLDMFCAQAGLFKIEEYDDSTVLNKKMITIKNLKYTGTAPQRGWGEFSTLLWNGPMIDSRSYWEGANTDTLAGTAVIGRYNYNAYRGSLSIDKPATNLTLENLFVSRNRYTEGPRYNGYTGLLVPEGFPGCNGTLVVDTVYCKLRDASFNSHFHTVFPQNFGISRVYSNTPVPKSITVKNVISDWRVDNFLWIGQSHGTPNSNRALKGQPGRDTWYDGYWRPYAYDYKVNTQDAFAPNSGDSAARIFANSTGWLFRTMPTSNLAETFIVQNNYAIDVSGNIDRNPSGTSSGAYPNTSLVTGITWTSHDANTLIPTFQTFPFSGYSNLTDVPIIQPAVGGNWYSLTTIHLDYDDVYGMDLKQFLTDLNGVTSHLKGYLTIAAKVDKGRYVFIRISWYN